jgi:hypothetical protein
MVQDSSFEFVAYSLEYLNMLNHNSGFLSIKSI